MKAFSLFAGLLLVLASCQAQDAVPEGPLHPLKVGPATLRVEYAVTAKEHAYGLMNRSSLEPDRGMLFIFQNEARRDFWMKNTLIPLSIAYISKAGVIKEILDMKALSLDTVPSRYDVLYALEVNLGAFQKLGIKVGDTIDVDAVNRTLQSLAKPAE